MAPPIKVEYAKSARSRCTLKACNLFIQKGELRIGTGSMMPGADELSYKWRHLCCFTSRQIKNMQASVDNIEGFEDMEEEHQAIIHKMLKGQLEGDASVKGAIISATIAAAAEAGSSQKAGGGAKGGGKKKPGVGALLMGNSNTDLLPAGGPSQTTAATAKGGGLKREPTAAGKKRGRADVVTLDGFLVDCGVESDATDEYEVAVTDQKPSCPYGADCYHKNPNHFAKFRHPGDTAVQLPEGTKEATVVKKIIRQRKAPNAGAVESASWSGGGASSSSSSPPFTNAMPSSSASKGKEPCPYGSMCVLSSPAHLMQYAHGNEGASQMTSSSSSPPLASSTVGGSTAVRHNRNDGGSEKGAVIQGAFGTYSLEKKECPYGELCVLKTPAHLLQYSHPNDAAVAKSPQKPKPPSVSMVKKVPLVSPYASYPTSAQQPTSAQTSASATAGAYFNTATASAPPPSSGDGNKPMCPYLPMCLRSDAKHLAEFAH